MTNLDIVSVGVALGALISFGIISYALTAGVLHEYMLTEVMRSDGKRNTRPETSERRGS